MSLRHRQSAFHAAAAAALVGADTHQSSFGGQRAVIRELDVVAVMRSCMFILAYASGIRVRNAEPVLCEGRRDGARDGRQDELRIWARHEVGTSTSKLAQRICSLAIIVQKRNNSPLVSACELPDNLVCIPRVMSKLAGRYRRSSARALHNKRRNTYRNRPPRLACHPQPTSVSSYA